jgi:hypothetical protein
VAVLSDLKVISQPFEFLKIFVIDESNLKDGRADIDDLSNDAEASGSLDIVDEISNFIELIKDYRHLAKDANIKIKVVDSLDDL